MKMLDVPQSGSIGGSTSSRNRNGQYKRSRSTPVNPNSTFQGTVRARMSANAAAWRALTQNQREGWMSLGLMMNRTDSLGQSYNLTGFQSCCRFRCAGHGDPEHSPDGHGHHYGRDAERCLYSDAHARLDVSANLRESSAVGWPVL